MNTISTIITTLSSEEKKKFIAQLRKNNKRHDTLNIKLFTLLDSKETPKNLDEILYGKPSKNAYHALCKRLHDNLIDFIAGKSLDGDSSEEMSVLKLLLASRIFFEQKAYSIAFKTIRKAETKAKESDFFSILNEIYYTQIQYAHLYPKASLDTLIERFRENRARLKKEEQLNLFYATIHQQILQHPLEVAENIQSTLQTFDISVKDDISYRSLYKLLEIINTIANVARNFNPILSFVETTYHQLQAKGNPALRHLYYHIQILYYVANSYFRNLNFTNTNLYLEAMHTQMLQQNQRYYKRFLPQYTLVCALSHNYSGSWQTAIAMVDDFDFTKFTGELNYVLDLKLTQIVLYFQQSDFQKSWKLLQELYHSDHWYTEKTSTIWVIKKNLVEILLHIELDHVDLVDSRIKAFRKKHRAYLQNNKETRVLAFLSLVTSYYYKNEHLEIDVFTSKIESYLLQNQQQEDIFDMSFYAWLKAKILKKDIYEVTLEVVQSNQKKLRQSPVT